MKKIVWLVVLGFVIQGTVLADFDLAKFADGSSFYDVIVDNNELKQGLDGEDRAAIDYYLAQKAWLKDEKHMTESEIALFVASAAVASVCQTTTGSSADIELTAGEESLLASFCCAVVAYDITIQSKDSLKTCCEKAFKRSAARRQNNALKRVAAMNKKRKKDTE